MSERQQPKAVIVLEALLRGRRVTLAGRPCVLEGNELRVVATRWDSRTGESGECLLPFLLRIDDFLDACERLSDDEVFVIATQTALTKGKRKR